MRNLYLHVGLPKTGTSSLQMNFFPFVKNVLYLGKYEGQRKDCYPGVAFEKIRDLSRGKKSLFDLSALNGLSESKLLISEELLTFDVFRPSSWYEDSGSITHASVAEGLREIFPAEEFNVKVLITIRNQPDFIESVYAQSYRYFFSRTKSLDTFDKYLDEILNDKNKFGLQEGLNWKLLYESYADVFGQSNVTVLPYELMCQDPNCYLGRVGEWLGEDISNIEYLNKYENNRAVVGGRRTHAYTLRALLGMVKSKVPMVRYLKTPSIVRGFFDGFVIDSSASDGVVRGLSDAERLKFFEVCDWVDSNKFLEKHLDLKLDGYGYW